MEGSFEWTAAHVEVRKEVSWREGDVSRDERGDGDGGWERGKERSLMWKWTVYSFGFTLGWGEDCYYVELFGHFARCFEVWMGWLLEVLIALPFVGRWQVWGRS